MKRKLFALFLTATMMFSLTLPVSAKTIASEQTENVFFYALDTNGESVLLRVMPFEELRALSHGWEGGKNYWYSATDNYPTTQYTEARGVSVGELLAHVQETTSVSGAETLTFVENDTLAFMATDGYGNYSRNWSAQELYGEKRYYFEGLFDGWNIGWEIAGEDSSKFGITLDEYMTNYQDSDPNHALKRQVLQQGIEMPVILAVESYSGRTTSDALVASTEPGISSYIAANGGVAAGCLSNVLTEEHALRLCIPMTEADLMAGHRTAYDNFKWIYNLRLASTATGIISRGAVAQPEASFHMSGDTLTITLACDTQGADIYYGFDGAAQKRYTGPIRYDISDRDLSSQPLTIYMTAVKEGYSDVGVVTQKYPVSGVSFQSLYTAMTGEKLTFRAASSVTAEEWEKWADASMGVSMKTPVGSGYNALDEGKYAFDNKTKTVTFDESLFAESGSYSFIFYAKGYANKSQSVTLKKGVPDVFAPASSDLGSEITFTFADELYQKNLSVYVTAPGESTSTLISPAYLDRAVTGQITILEGYFALPSTKINESGTYTFTLSNTGYAPSTQTVEIAIGDGTSDGLKAGENKEENASAEVFGLALSWSEDPAVTVTAVWRDHAKLNSVMQVVAQAEYDKNGFADAMEFSALCRDVSLDGTGAWHYEAMAHGLQPDTDYVYRVGDEGRWSESHTFCTDDPDAETLTFVYMGDVQPNSDTKAEFALWGELAQAMLETAPELSFAVLGGDIVNSGISLEQFDCFFENAQPVASSFPLMATNGNHESNFPGGKPELYLDLFSFPQNGPEGFEEEFYSFDVANCHILVLNSWVFSGEQNLSEADIETINGWIAADLASSTADWQVVITHIPVYAVHSDTTAAKVRENWEEIFLNYGVDLVFVGHQHVYSRTYPLNNGKVDYENGIPYIMGVSGSKFYDSADETFAERTIYDTATYQLVRVDGDTMTVQTLDADGNELDYAVIQQRETQGGFWDVTEDDWYKEAVDYVCAEGWMSGDSAALFKPDESMARADFVSALYRYMGVPIPSAADPFEDTEKGTWYSDALAWAYESGYVNGIGEGAFAPDADLSLEQALTVLWRIKGCPKVADASGLGSVSSWASDAAAWALEHELLNGVGGTLAAEKSVDRAQVAALLMNFDCMEE